MIAERKLARILSQCRADLQSLAVVLSLISSWPEGKSCNGILSCRRRVGRWVVREAGGIYGRGVWDSTKWTPSLDWGGGVSFVFNRKGVCVWDGGGGVTAHHWHTSEEVWFSQPFPSSLVHAHHPPFSHASCCMISTTYSPPARGLWLLLTHSCMC